MKAKYIAFDCETTGLDYDNSELLTVYFKFLGNELEPLDELELNCKPDTVYYKIDIEAMRVNKIDLIKHHDSSISYQEARKLLLEKMKLMASDDPLIPIGHNYFFDEFFCKKKLLPEWNSYISRRGLDTATIAQFLKLSEKLPENFNISLPKLAYYFGIPNQGAHDAKFDTNMTIEVLKHLKLLAKQ